MFCKEIERIYKPQIYWNGVRWVGEYQSPISLEWTTIVLSQSRRESKDVLVKKMNCELVRGWKGRWRGRSNFDLV